MIRLISALSIAGLLDAPAQAPATPETAPAAETPAADKPATDKPAEAKPAPAGKPENPAAGEEDKPAAKPEAGEPKVPDDLLEDEHLREEYGVNQFTTPSIRKIFSSLDKLGSLPYDSLKRELPKETSSDRSLVALSLGVLIGDGFLSVQSEKISDLEDVGRAILRHAKNLGAGARITEHAKSLMENGALGDWKSLKDDLAATQKDAESEMVLLRDTEIAHLVSLGGWLRGLQLVSGAAREPFDPEKATVLARADIAEYFAAMLSDLNPALQKQPHVEKLRAGLEEIRQMVDVPEGKVFDKAQVDQLFSKSSELVKLITKVD